MASKETRGNFGKSRTGRTIRRKITITKNKPGKRKVKVERRGGGGRKISFEELKRQAKAGQLGSATITKKSGGTPGAQTTQITKKKSGRVSVVTRDTRPQQSRRVIQGGGIFEVNEQTGGFRRIGLTSQEQARRERVRTDTATAQDYVPRLSTGQTQQERGETIIRRLQTTQLRKAEKEAERQTFGPRVSKLPKKPPKVTISQLLQNYNLGRAKQVALVSNPVTKIYSYIARKDRNLYNALVGIQRNRASLSESQLKKQTATGQAQLMGLAFISGFIQFAEAIVSLPTVINQIAKNPSLVKQIGSNLLSQTKEFGVLLKNSPFEAVARLGSEIVILKGTGVALRALNKLRVNAFVRLNPKYTGIARIGQKLNIKLPKGRVAVLEVVGKIPKKSIPSQLALSGKTVEVAISSQANKLLTSVLGRAKKIAKPIGAKIPKSDKITNSLLKRLDTGKITRKELGILDNRLSQKYQIKGLLERSFFADPSGKIRPSRLGLEGDAPTFLDIIKGNFTFRSSKPQILIFANIAVEKFPAYLKPIIRKLKKGGKLTQKETNDLLYFQTRQTGKFKPLGFVSKESEITLAQGEILKRVKTVGVTVINGKKVPIILTEVYSPSKAIKAQIAKLLDDKLLPVEIRKLDKFLKKKTGINYKLSSKSVPQKRINLNKLISSKLISRANYRKSLSKLSKTSRSSRPSRTSRTSKTSKTSRPSRTSRTSRTSKTSGTSRTSKTSGTSRTSKTSGTSRAGSSRGLFKAPPPPPKKPLLLPKRKPLKSVSNPKGYDVYITRAGKLVRMNKRAYTKLGAAKFGRWLTNNSTARSFKVVGVGRKAIKLPKFVQKTPNKLFRQPKKKSKLAPKTFVEKRKYAINTRGERKGLRASQLLKRVSKPRKAKKRATIKRKTARKAKKGKRKPVKRKK